MQIPSEKSFVNSFAGAAAFHDLGFENTDKGSSGHSLYKRSWNLSFIKSTEGVDPEADFLVFHFEQRAVSFTFTVIVLTVTVISVVTRTNVQVHWLVGMICAWVIWGGCLIAMVFLWHERKLLVQRSSEIRNEHDGGDSIEMTAQSLVALPAVPHRRRPHTDTTEANDDANTYRRTQLTELPIFLLRTTTLQQNAAYWERIMVLCCAATLCFSISLYLGKQNCIRGVNVSPEAILDTCTGSVQFDAAFVVIYTGAAILLNIRVKLFCPILLLMNIIFFTLRSIPEIPGVPTLVPEIVASYAMVSFVQTCLCVGMVYVRESTSRDYFETSQRLQFHTLRLSKLRNETERDITRFCPPEAAKGVAEGHGLFQYTKSAVVCVLSINGLAAWNSLRCPMDGIEATNRFVEVLDGLRIVFDFKPTKYDTIGDRYVVMDSIDMSRSQQQVEVVQNIFGFALLAVAECNLQLVPLLKRDAFLPPGQGGDLTHTTCVECRDPLPLRLCAAVELGSCACMYCPKTENVVVVGECYDRALQTLKICNVCSAEHVSSTLFRFLHEDGGMNPSHAQSCEIARSIAVGSTVCDLLSSTMESNSSLAASQQRSQHSGGGSPMRNHAHLNFAEPNSVMRLPPVVNPLVGPLASSGYAPSEPLEMNGIPLLLSECNSFCFADLSLSHTTWINLTSKVRRDAKPMRHDNLAVNLHLQWVLVLVRWDEPKLSTTPATTTTTSTMIGNNNNNNHHGEVPSPTPHQQPPASASASQSKLAASSSAVLMQASGSTLGQGTGGVASYAADQAAAAANASSSGATHPSLLAGSGVGGDDAHFAADAPTSTAKGDAGHFTEHSNPNGLDDSSSSGGGDIRWHMFPTFSFTVPDIENEYQLWSRGPIQFHMLLVSFAGCAAACAVLIGICAMYRVTEMDAFDANPMPWAILSWIAATCGLVWSCRLYLTQRRTTTTTAPVGTRLERLVLTFLFYAQAALYTAAVMVSPQGSSALGNGQLLWIYALFGISMSRPQWYGPLTMWTLDALTAAAFLVLWALYPYRTSDIKTTHLFLIGAAVIYPLAVRYVMETAKRSAFVTELRVWVLQEKLNTEYDLMQVALQHIAPNFIGDEIVQALRQHHICHPDAYGVMCVVLPQVAICAVLELRVVEGTGSISGGTTMASMKRLGLAITSILRYVEGVGGDCISPLRVDGTRIVLCGGVAKRDRREHEEGLYLTDRTIAERAHQFLRCCYDIVYTIKQPPEHRVQIRCFLTCGWLLGGVIGTGRISFNFFGPKISIALHAFPEMPWNGVNHLVATSGVVMMQSIVEEEAKRRQQHNPDGVVLTPTEKFHCSSHNSSAAVCTPPPPAQEGFESDTKQPQIHKNTTNAQEDHETPSVLSAETVTKLPKSQQHSKTSSSGRRAAGSSGGGAIVPHGIQFSNPTSLRVRGFAPIGVQFAQKPT
jgi:hypothetical protein